MGALDQAVRSGKALYVGISSYGPDKTREAARILADQGTPFIIHQPSYSMLNRWVEDGLLDVLDDIGIGCIVFSPLAQGLLTNRYLDGVPAGSRATAGDSFDMEMLSDENLSRVRSLHEVASRRGQTLAQMAISWVLRDPRVTSALIGASRWTQIEDALGALDNIEFTPDELEQIDRYAVEGDINIWAGSSEHG
jgi:L-glyceraldehyde 3-phosphate reductase